jgi:hypothetical protein
MKTVLFSRRIKAGDLPEIPLLHIYPKATKAYAHENSYTNVPAASLITAQKGKQSKYHKLTNGRTKCDMDEL